MHLEPELRGPQRSLFDHHGHTEQYRGHFCQTVFWEQPALLMLGPKEGPGQEQRPNPNWQDATAVSHDCHTLS